MTPLNLINSLARELDSASRRFKLPVQYSENRVVKVYRQAIPAQDYTNIGSYPLICVELLGVTDEVEFATAEVLITIGVFSDGDNGYLDLLNLSGQLREWLLTHKLIDCYSLQLPTYFGVVEHEDNDFLFANILCNYEIPAIVPRYLDF